MKWINVEDRLPELGKLVLVNGPRNIYDLDNISNTGGWLRGAYCNDPLKSNITHWAEITRPDEKSKN